MKGVVKIKNMRIYGFHGCLKEESKIGGDYLVTLKAYCDMACAAETDSLEETANYTLLAKIITKEMAVLSFLSLLQKELLTLVSRKLLLLKG